MSTQTTPLLSAQTNTPIFDCMAFGNKDERNFVFDGKIYDHICYYVDGDGHIIKGQQFTSITNDEGMILIFGQPLYHDDMCYISQKFIDWLYYKRFRMEEELRVYYLNHGWVKKHMLDLPKFFKYHNCQTLIYPPLENVTPATETQEKKYKWEIACADTWMEIPTGTESIKVIPNGKPITFRYNDFLYRKLTNDELVSISKIQNKPYALLSVGNYQSVFLIADIELRYKYAAAVKTDFCFRDYSDASVFPFHVKNPIAVYSKVEGKITCGVIVVNPSKNVSWGMYHYDMTGLQSGQYTFVRSDDKPYSTQLFIERKI
jgi:hypothetical protein